MKKPTYTYRQEDRTSQELQISRSEHHIKWKMQQRNTIKNRHGKESVLRKEGATHQRIINGNKKEDHQDLRMEYTTIWIGKLDSKEERHRQD